MVVIQNFQLLRAIKKHVKILDYQVLIPIVHGRYLVVQFSQLLRSLVVRISNHKIDIVRELLLNRWYWNHDELFANLKLVQKFYYRRCDETIDFHVLGGLDKLLCLGLSYRC